MRRREFITLVGSAISAIPVATYAQQSTPKVVGVVVPENLIRADSRHEGESAHHST
jgi:hypothetical protein